MSLFQGLGVLGFYGLTVSVFYGFSVCKTQEIPISRKRAKS